MSYEQKPLENGTIFLTRNNSTNPKAPPFKGTGKDDHGRDIEIAFWEGVSPSGKPWKRIKIGPPYERQGGTQAGAYSRPSSPTPSTRPPDESDVPF
jgi:hypothetical protein